MLYKWQEKALAAIDGKSAILSAPTGSGKTWVAYIWAGLMERDGTPRMPEGRVIFTAPIKALSNERYLDLKGMGFDVGLETGDFKKNAGAAVLCCTQEIYTLKYAHLPGQSVVIDEFHFIFNDPERARAYIDGLRGTSDDSRILVMSATFGNPERVRDYLQEMARRDFALFETNARVTKLVYKQRGTRFAQIRDALIFAFSKKGVEWAAAQTAKTRHKISRGKRARLREIAEILEVTKIPDTMLRGVGMYFGSMLPKEKLLVEMAFRERIIDVVAGTDALSLGVNLPAESVIFAQMAKFIDGPLTRNEFLQMAGTRGTQRIFQHRLRFIHPAQPLRKLRLRHGDTVSGDPRQAVRGGEDKAAPRDRPPAQKRSDRRDGGEDPLRMLDAAAQPALRHARGGKLTARDNAGALRDKGPAGTRPRAPHPRRHMERRNGARAQRRARAPLRRRGRAGRAQMRRAAQKNRTQLSAGAAQNQALRKRLPEQYRFSHMEKIDEAVNEIDGSVFGFEDKIHQIKLTEETEM